MEHSLTVAPAALGTDESGDITRLACVEPSMEGYAVHIEDDGALGSEDGITGIKYLDRREVSSAALLGRLSGDHVEPVEFLRRGEGRLAPIRPIKKKLSAADLGALLDDELHFFGAIGDGVAEGETEGRVGGIIPSLDEAAYDRMRVERLDRIDRVGTPVPRKEYARLSCSHPQDADDLMDELGLGERDRLPELSATIHESLHTGLMVELARYVAGDFHARTEDLGACLPSCGTCGAGVRCHVLERLDAAEELSAIATERSGGDVDDAHDAFGIDDEGPTGGHAGVGVEHTVAVARLTRVVGDHLIRESFQKTFAEDPCAVGVDGIGRCGDDFDAEFFHLGADECEVSELGRTYERKIRRVEEEYSPATCEVGELDRRLVIRHRIVCGEVKIRGWAVDSDEILVLIASAVIHAAHSRVG